MRGSRSGATGMPNPLSKSGGVIMWQTRCISHCSHWAPCARRANSTTISRQNSTRMVGMDSGARFGHRLWAPPNSAISARACPFMCRMRVGADSRITPQSYEPKWSGVGGMGVDAERGTGGLASPKADRGDCGTVSGMAAAPIEERPRGSARVKPACVPVGSRGIPANAKGTRCRIGGAHKLSRSVDGTVRYFFRTSSRMGVPEKPYSSRSRCSR